MDEKDPVLFGEDFLPDDLKDDPEETGKAPADFGQGDTKPDPGKAFQPDDTGKPVRPRRGPGRPPVMVGDPSKTVAMRGIPKRMLAIAKRAFEGDVTQLDAFIAYLVCNCPEFAADRDLRSLALTDRQKALVAASDDSAQNAMSKKLDRMASKLDAANRQIASLTGMLCLLLYEYTGNKTTTEKLTADRIMDKDFMRYDGGHFAEFQEALSIAFQRYSQYVAESRGAFFSQHDKR